MKYLGKVTDPKDLCTKEYADKKVANGIGATAERSVQLNEDTTRTTINTFTLSNPQTDYNGLSFNSGVDEDPYPEIYTPQSAVLDGKYATTMNEASFACGRNSFAHGHNTVAHGDCSEAGGESCVAAGGNSRAFGRYTLASGFNSLAEGWNTIASGNQSRAGGINTRAVGSRSYANGVDTHALGENSFTAGDNTLTGMYGFKVSAFDTTNLTLTLDDVTGITTGSYYSLVTARDSGADHWNCGTVDAINNKTITVSAIPTITDWVATDNTYIYFLANPMIGTTVLNSDLTGIPNYGYNSAVFGKDNIVLGQRAFSNGYGCDALGNNTFTSGYKNSARGSGSMANGNGTKALGSYAFTVGRGTTASGIYSFAEGDGTKATKNSSHAEGIGTSATGQAQHVSGKYNVENSDYLFIVGNGTADNSRRNAAALTADGTLRLDGDVYVNCGASSTDGTKVLTSHQDISGKMDKSNPSGTGSFSLNRKSGTTIGDYSFAEGESTTASGSCSHAEGITTTASGSCSHAEGQGTSVSQQIVAVTGCKQGGDDYTLAFDAIEAPTNYNLYKSLTIGSSGIERTIANFVFDVETQEVVGVRFTSEYSFSGSTSKNLYLLATKTEAIANYSHTEGYLTRADGANSHAEGEKTRTVGRSSHAEGSDATASGSYSHAEGNSTIASGHYSHAEGFYATASGGRSHAEGNSTIASGHYSHAEGSRATASGGCSHAEGSRATASGSCSHAEGEGTTASGYYSHAEGESTTASGYYSHAEGYNTTASGYYSHAEGYCTTASGSRSHAEGESTEASGQYSHAEGCETIASGMFSHAEGITTTAQRQSQHVSGEYNVLDTGGSGTTTRGNYALIVGNGTGTSARSNALALGWSGNLKLNGNVYVECNADSTNGTMLCKSWSGTQAQYDALSSKDENTYYYITD